MADETAPEAPPANTITVSISEYNQLKADSSRVMSLESSLADTRSKFNTITAEHEALKATKGKVGPSKEELEQQLRQEFGARLEDSEKKAQDYESRLRKLVITDKVMSLLGGKLIPSAEKFIRYEIEKECDIEGDFDTGQIIVKDEQGNPKWSAIKPASKMSAEEYVTSLQERYPDFVRSTARAGENDARPSSNTTTTHGAISWDMVNKLSDAELRKIPPAQLDKLLKEQGL